MYFLNVSVSTSEPPNLRSGLIDPTARSAHVEFTHLIRRSPPLLPAEEARWELSHPDRWAWLSRFAAAWLLRVGLLRPTRPRLDAVVPLGVGKGRLPCSERQPARN